MLSRMRVGVFFKICGGVLLCSASMPTLARAQALTGFDPLSPRQPSVQVQPVPNTFAEASRLTAFDPPPVVKVQSARAGNARINAPLTAASFEPSKREERAVRVTQGKPKETSSNVIAKTEPILRASDPTQGEKTGTSAPVDFQADTLNHDQEQNIVTATGNVMMVQDERILRADEITYYLNEDRVVAIGNVVLNEPNGDIHLAQEVELFDGFKNGFVEKLQSILVDESRLSAKSGQRENASKIIMRGARYTPCAICGPTLDEEDRPSWAIRASKITYDEEQNRISYNNPRFEVYGVPVAYLPYFSHPDGTVEQKSGFMTPSFGFRSDLGAFIENSYYWGISPDQDATFGLVAFTQENPVFLSEYRKRWENASLELAGGITQSERFDRVGLDDIRVEEDVRGHIFGNGRWDINDKLRAGTRINYVSDDQYLRQYNFSSQNSFANQNILENEIFLERFSGRNYAVGRILAFQDLRIFDPATGFGDIDQPQIFPEVATSFVGEPGSVPFVGGRWGADFSLLGLRRDGEEQDLNRFSTNLSWEKRSVNFGVLTNVNASLRGDYFNVRDSAVSEDDTSNEMRFFPQVHIESAYPLAKQFKRFQWTVEPVAALTLAPNLSNQPEIPNEDSQDIQIDASNLFEANRFPGLDAIEDQSRVTYGFRSGVYGHDGSFFRGFLGQSRRFEDDDNPFPEGSGLTDQQSDVVGEVAANYAGKHSLNYRFQLENDSLASERHEIDVLLGFERLTIGARYLFADAFEGTNSAGSREQFNTNILYQFTDRWGIGFGGIQDLGDTPGLRQAFTTLNYDGDCVRLSITGERNLTDPATGENENQIFFRVGLKNLSDF